MNICEIEKDPINFIFESVSLGELQGRFKDICEYYNIEKYALVKILKEDKKSLDNKNEFTCYDNYPEEWIKMYNSNKYYLKDPVLIDIKNMSQATYWHIENFKDATIEQKRILDECADFNIKRGTTIPLLPNNKYNRFLTLIGTDIHDPKVIYNLANAAVIYFERNEYFVNKNKRGILTTKEQEIMELKALGYHNKQISEILSRNYETIALHLKNIRKKFGVFTTEQAIAKYYQDFFNS
ncbi:MAG: autoinducer binding domain-containing protein [Candidatus Paracaedibacteraceae bacterium]|nr:autoinducer binding domain-containing protein [Candidatus Paracaedibacteraceae bacterium]